MKPPVTKQVLIKRATGRTIVKKYSVFMWFENGSWHREDGPAIVVWFESTGFLCGEFWLKGRMVRRLNQGNE